jgi:hypothetical protein
MSAIGVVGGARALPPAGLRYYDNPGPGKQRHPPLQHFCPEYLLPAAAQPLFHLRLNFLSCRNPAARPRCHRPKTVFCARSPPVET